MNTKPYKIPQNNIPQIPNKASDLWQKEGTAKDIGSSSARRSTPAAPAAGRKE